MRNWMMVGAAALVACGGGEDRTEAILALDGDPVNGAVVYEGTCQSCHAASGLGEDDPETPGSGENLSESAAEVGEDGEIIDLIIAGEGAMTPLGDVLSDQEIADVVAYLHDGLFE